VTRQPGDYPDPNPNPNPNSNPNPNPDPDPNPNPTPTPTPNPNPNPYPNLGGGVGDEAAQRERSLEQNLVRNGEHSHLQQGVVVRGV